MTNSEDISPFVIPQATPLSQPPFVIPAGNLLLYNPAKISANGIRTGVPEIVNSGSSIF